MGIKINGVSIPVGGISWEYTESKKKGIQEMFYYLESKRILTNPMEMEIKEWSEKSAIEIKNKLVNFAKSGYPVVVAGNIYGENKKTISTTLVDNSSYIYTCNEFLDDMQKIDASGIIYKNSQKDWCDMRYSAAMKKFRKNFRYNIKLLTEEYDIEFLKEIPEEY